jgi:hypothetical protein
LKDAIEETENIAVEMAFFKDLQLKGSMMLHLQNLGKLCRIESMPLRLVHALHALMQHCTQQSSIAFALAFAMRWYKVSGVIQLTLKWA